jgi:SAM-dependent methyltransferase
MTMHAPRRRCEGAVSHGRTGEPRRRARLRAIITMVRSRTTWTAPPAIHFGDRPVNRIHHLLCRSAWWRRTAEARLLPWALRGLHLGDQVLEIGPGFGATTSVLARNTAALTVVEIDGKLADRLRATLPATVRVITGDGTDLPFPDHSFSAVLCFTMLHHLPSGELQDRLFAEAYRTLQPGGVFAGTDSLPSLAFRLLHLADTMTTVDPGGLPDRLEAAGFATADTATVNNSLRFRAHRGAEKSR